MSAVETVLMKDYLQPAATFALALAIGSLGFTLAPAVEAVSTVYLEGGNDLAINVRHLNGCAK